MRSAAAGAVLDIHSDPEHHRSVYTIVADEDELASALFAGIARAAELIDLREHDGIHPRVGAADVVPIVPLAAGADGRARARWRSSSGSASATSSGCRCFSTATSADGVRPAFFRRGGPAELQRRIDGGELRPSFGPARARPARRRGADRRAAAADRVQHRARRRATSRTRRRSRRRCGRRAVACRASRRSGCCSRRAGRVQVSINVIDVEQAPLADGGRARAGGGRRARGGGRARASSSACCPRRAVADPALLGLEALPDDARARAADRGRASARTAPVARRPSRRRAHTSAMEIAAARGTAEAAGARRDLLVDAVDGGGANGFLRPLAPSDASAYWEGRIDDIDGRALDPARVARRGRRAPGIVVLDLAGQQNGQHRAEVTKLMVHSSARRQGLGARLLAEAEDAARARGRWLLVLDTVPGSDAERLYRRHGWIEVGAIPDFALLPDGDPAPTVVFYKRLG